MSLTTALRNIFGLTARAERQQALERLKQEIQKGDVARNKTSAHLSQLSIAISDMECAFAEQTACLRKSLERERDASKRKSGEAPAVGGHEARAS